MRIDHDQNFKQLIQAFFREFMELFLPKVAARIDFSRVEFLDKEYFTVLPEGSRRQLDLVVKVGLRAGGEELLLIHCEFESTKNVAEFPFRFCLYHCQLLLRHRLPIVPIAVFTDDAKWRVQMPDHYEVGFEEEIYLRFKYHLLKLKDFTATTYMRSENPLAVALAAKMDYDKRQYIRLKADFLRLVLGTNVDGARKNLLLEFIQTYMPLNSAQAIEFQELVEAPAYKEVVKVVTTWELRGIAKGKA